MASISSYIRKTNMSLPRLLPKRLFQVIALVTLTASVSVAVQMIISKSVIYRWLQNGLGSGGRSGLVLLLLSVVVWIVCIVPLRLMSTMPTLREELTQLEATSLRDLIARAVQAGRAQADGPFVTLEEQCRYHRTLAIGALLTAIIFGLVTAATLAWDSSLFLIGPLLIAMIGLIMVPWHATRLFLLSRRK